MAKSADTHLITLILKAVDQVSPEADKMTKKLEKQQKVLEDIHKQTLNNSDEEIKQIEEADKKRIESVKNNSDAIEKETKRLENIRKLRKENLELANQEVKVKRIAAGYYKDEKHDIEISRVEGEKGDGYGSKPRWVVVDSKGNYSDPQKTLREAKKVASNITKINIEEDKKELAAKEREQIRVVKNKIDLTYKAALEIKEVRDRLASHQHREHIKRLAEAENAEIKSAKKVNRVRMGMLIDGFSQNMRNLQRLFDEMPVEQQMLKNKKLIRKYVKERDAINATRNSITGEIKSADAERLEVLYQKIYNLRDEIADLKLELDEKRLDNKKERGQEKELKSLSDEEKRIAKEKAAREKKERDQQQAYWNAFRKFNKQQAAEQAKTDKQKETARKKDWAEFKRFWAAYNAAWKQEDKRNKAPVEHDLAKADAASKYLTLLEKEKRYLKDNNDSALRQRVEAEKFNAAIELSRQNLKEMGVDYAKIDDEFAQIIDKAEQEVEIRKEQQELLKERARFKWDKDRDVFSNLRGNFRALRINIDNNSDGINNFQRRVKEVIKSGGQLARNLGRVGLAMRGMIVVGVLAFIRAMIASISALVASIIGLAGSLVYAASALGGTFVAAGMQALPVIGLLIAAFQRFKAIQEAVQQQDLLSKQTSGEDNKAAQDAIDNSQKIADAQLALAEAQRNLTDARKDARKELQDLIIAEREAELALRGSVLSQVESERSLRKAIGEGDVEDIASRQLDRDASKFDVFKSRRELKEARNARRTGLAGGPEGTETYKNALKAVTDAQRALANAHKASAQAANTQLAAERNLNYALGDLSEAEKKLYKQFIAFRDRFKKVTQPITDILIGAFSTAFSKVEKLLFNEGILSAFTKLAEVMGASLNKIADLLTGPAFTKFFEQLIGQTSKNMPIITKMFMNLATILANIATGAAPALTRLLEYINDGLARFADHTSDSNAMNDFFQTGLDHFEAWMSLIGAIIGLFGELMKAAGPSQLGIIKDFTDLINGAKDSLKEDNSGAVAFFEDAADGLRQIGRVLLEIGKAFVRLSGSEHIKALADVFVYVLIPGLEISIKWMGAFAIMLDYLIEVPIVGTFLKWSVAIGAFAASMSLTLGFFKPLYKVLKAIFGVFFDASKWGATKFLDDIKLAFMGIKESMKLGGIANFFKLFTKGLAGIPVVGWIVAAVIEVIIGAITALIENFGGIRDYVVDQFSDVIDVFEDLGASIGDLFGSFSGSGEGGMGGFKDFLAVLWDIVGAIFNVIAFLGKLIGTIAIWNIVTVLVTPLKLVVGLLSKIIKFIAQVTGAFNKLFSGEISFTEFVSQMGNALKDLILGILGVIGQAVGSIFKGLGNIIFAAMEEALDAIFGEGFTTKVVNVVIDVVNWIIRRINDVTPGIIGDIDEIEEYAPKKESTHSSELTASSRMSKAERRKFNENAEGKDKSGKATKEATKYELGFAKALKQSGGISQKNVRISNRMSDALDRTSRAHRKARNFQEGLRTETNKATNAQSRYVNAVRNAAKAEERLNDALRRSKRVKQGSNEIDRESIGLKGRAASASNKTSSSQSKLNKSIARAIDFQTDLNKEVRAGAKFQNVYDSRLTDTTASTREQTQATGKLSRRFVGLNDTLKVTGENSRALGMVFKQVTNRILTEFNANPIKVNLPEVGSMFKEATGGVSAFQTGGYFGDKKQRGPDDRIIKVAGGEAILTGHQQRAANTAFAIANRAAGFKYDSLDTMFKHDSRPHATAPAFNTGGVNRGGRNSRSGSAGGRSIVIPRSVPDAMGALPGLDLVAWLSNKYFGVPVSDGIRAAGTLTSSGNVSDHTWGGAVDLSNGGAPTPQMDAAWRWFAQVLGGGAPSGFVESFSGGAIKQMLYRTNIGGNHFNHIHIALLESYARNVEALTKILTGKAIPVSTGGAMFASAPQLKKPELKGTKGAPLNMLQGQSDKLTGAANKLLKRRIQTAAGGSAIPMGPLGQGAVGPLGGIQGTGISQGEIEKIRQHPNAGGQVSEGEHASTAYGPPWNALQGSGITSTGVTLGSDIRKYLVAVDPYTNNYGTFPYIWPNPFEWTGPFVAADTGGAFLGQGQKVDFYDWRGRETQYGWGTRPVRLSRSPIARGGRNGPAGHARGGFVLPEFNDGGIVPGPRGKETIIKAHGGETVLPTHKSSYRKKLEPITKAKKTVTKDSAIDKLQNLIDKLRKKADKAEKWQTKDSLRERILNIRDRITQIKERNKFNSEIKNIRKDIVKKQKELDEAETKADKKKLAGELKDLNSDLRDVIKEKKNTRVFRGGVYDVSKINDYILFIADRLDYFMAQIENNVAKAQLATLKWTYKIKRFKGKEVVSKVNTLIEESRRALSDLIMEFDDITKNMRKNRKAKRQTTRKLNKTRRSYDKDLRRLQRQFSGLSDDLKDAETDEEKEKIKNKIKDIKKEIEKTRKLKKDDLDKLRTSLRNTNKKYTDLAKRRAENIAARYEAQQAIFEEIMSKFDKKTGMIDTKIKIAELRNQDEDGNLTDEGKEKVKKLYENKADVLRAQRERIRKELQEARKIGNKEKIQDLQQAMLDNELALIENTNSIKELDKQVDKTFNFQSTSWQLFRRAVLNGNGQIIPELNSSIPQLASGGYIKSDGLAYLHAAEVVVPASGSSSNSGPLVDKIEFTQPMEVADPIALSNQIGFKLSTLKAI